MQFLWFGINMVGIQRNGINKTAAITDVEHVFHNQSVAQVFFELIKACGFWFYMTSFVIFFALHLPIGGKWRKIEENTMFSVKSTDFYRIFAIKPWIYKCIKKCQKWREIKEKNNLYFFVLAYTNTKNVHLYSILQITLLKFISLYRIRFYIISF